MRFLEKALRRLWFSCGGHCHTHSDGGASCPLMDGANPTQRSLDPQARRFGAGGALVGAAMVVFLLPLVMAIGGAFLAGEYLAPPSSGAVGWWQAAGMLAGLVVGVAIAKLLLFLVRSRQTISGGGDE